MTTAKQEAMCLAGICKGLQMANPTNSQWITSNDLQKRFLEEYSKGAFIDLKSLKEYVEGMATKDNNEMIKWFAKKGFPGMNIEQIPAGGCAIGTIFDLLVDWITAGKKTDIYLEESEKWYDGVQMEVSANAKAFNLTNYPYPMFQLGTNQGWQVFLVEADTAYHSIDLPKKALQLLNLKRSIAEYLKFKFPAVNMQTNVNVSWLEQMNVPGFRIDQAIKKVKLRVDDKGARAQSAFVIIYRGGGSSVPTYVIRKPFFVIFWKDGLNFPPFVAISDPTSWIKNTN